MKNFSTLLENFRFEECKSEILGYFYIVKAYTIIMVNSDNDYPLLPIVKDTYTRFISSVF